MSVVIQIKAIKPKRLQAQAFADEIQAQLEKEGEFIKSLYERTTATWRRKPQFEILTDISGGNVSVLVGTDDEIYGYVDKGTRPHIIRPRRASRLRFRSGYTAKTSPRTIGSRAGGASGKVVYARQVMHPGSAARQFSEVIHDKTRKQFKRNIQEAMKRGARRAQGGQ